MNKIVTPLSRRKFISLAGSSALAVSLSGQKVLGANERVRMALISCGGRANSLASQFAGVPGVEIVAICDPDTAQMESLIKRQAKKEIDLSKVEQIQDYRKVYERNDIDAVVISSPNHWHTLHAIEAMAAGKHVYVEKPVSHNLWEGKQLVAAEKKYGKVIAAGTQNRSDPGPQAGIQYVQEGNLGKILSVHACCFRNRSSIGAPLAQPLVPPSTIDYNLWLGPVEDKPIYRPRFHYDWHWIFNTGDGDIGNQAPHEIDMMWWLMGDPSLPVQMKSFGGRFGWNDAGNTPNMHTAWFMKKGIPCIIEVNDLWVTPEENRPGIRDQVRVGIVVRCEGGELRGGRGGMYVVGEDGTTKIEKFPGDGGQNHAQNFIDAVRAGNNRKLAAKITNSVKSANLAHLANISYRTGSEVPEKRLRAMVKDDKQLNLILDEQAAQLKNWGIDQPKYTRGQIIKVDPKTATVKNEGVEKLVRPLGRKEFSVPELV
jgi:predicted dehydrogenase